MNTARDNSQAAGEQFMAPGWYIDPADPGVQRRWDGYGWTEETAPAPTPQQPAFTRPTGAGNPTADTAKRILERNTTSLIALAVCALYLVIDNYTNLVVFGLIPISLSIQAIRRREPLSLVAVVGTIAAVAAPFVLFNR
jgi:hypothetical protein